MVECKDCKHLRLRPGDTVWKRKSGCYHPKHMVQSQSEGFLKEQEIPGDHTVINADGRCPEWEPKPPRKSLIARIAVALRS
jgi:hypothetical protein